MDAKEFNTEEKSFFKYHGKGGELFGVFLVNALLTIITLGVYYFWAKVKLIKYYYEQTEFMGYRFSYHGTGKERFVGFLKGIGIVVLGLIALFAVAYLLMSLISLKAANFIMSALLYLALLAISPLVLIGKERYRLSRSSYRNIRFQFTGKFTELAELFIVHGLMTVVTLGIYSPWFYCKYAEFFAKNSFYGNQNFQFQAEPKELFILFLKGIFLTPLTLGVYVFWFRANLYRFYWSHVTFQNKQFNADTYTGGGLMKTTGLALLASVLSLGAALPWALNWLNAYQINHLTFLGTVDFASIEGSMDKKASALSDGISDAADVLGDMLS
ncbi:MAG: DUF898 family protein [Leptospiraceae bacterium]|nr:DUF898 family protein [Leptospiraceae bacterium]